jgi:hypothetical protein
MWGERGISSWAALAIPFSCIWMVGSRLLY